MLNFSFVGHGNGQINFSQSHLNFFIHITIYTCSFICFGAKTVKRK